MPYSSAYVRDSASRSDFAPQVIAYWLMSASMARFAASFSACGAAKFGKPCARLMPPWMAFSRVISRITDSVKPAVRAASFTRAVRTSVCPRLSWAADVLASRRSSVARLEVDAVEQVVAGLEAAQVLDEERKGALADVR